jgi:hypothetical protein
MTPNVDKAAPERTPVAQTSLRVGIKAAQTLYYAEEQAERIGLPLNVSITINFASLGVTLRDAPKVFKKLRNDRFSPWARRPTAAYASWSMPPTYTYGFENSRDGIVFEDPDGPHNVHVHWVAHIPAARHYDFEGQLYDWVTEVAGSPDWPANALKIKPITRPGYAAQYPLKGASASTAKRYGVPSDKVAPQGIIIGERTRTTLNLGPKARRSLDHKLRIRRPRPR